MSKKGQKGPLPTRPSAESKLLPLHTSRHAHTQTHNHTTDINHPPPPRCRIAMVTMTTGTISC